MLVGSRFMLRMHRQTLQRQVRTFSSQSAEYQTIDDAIFFTPNTEVNFDQGERSTVFNADDSSERRFVPFEMKENVFKHTMGFLGACFVGHMYPGVWCQFAAAGFVLNGSFRGVQMMSQTVRKIELHKDGKTVTLYPGLSCIGKFDCQIKDIKKLRHEKTLLDTYEEGYMFPIEIQGKKWTLHGTSFEAVKNGEVFRAILNGQSIKL